MTREQKPTRKRSRPGLTLAERQAKHRRTYSVHLVALKQPTVDLIRGVREYLKLPNDSVVLAALHDLLARRGLQATTDARGQILISPAAKERERRQAPRGAGLDKAVVEQTLATTKLMTANGSALARRGSKRSAPGAESDQRAAGQGDLFGTS